MNELPNGKDGFPNPEGLSSTQLQEIITHLQGILWADEFGDPDPDKEWGSDTIEQVADLLTVYGLRPVVVEVHK